MRKLVLTLAAVAAVGFALPVMSNPAEARDVVVIKRDRGYHHGWYRHRDRDWTFRHRHRDYDRHGPALIVRPY